MNDEEFEKKYADRSYLMLFSTGNSVDTLDAQVEQATRFGFRPHGSLVCPEPRFYIQPMIRNTLDTAPTAIREGSNGVQAINTLTVVMNGNDYALSVRMAAAEGLGYAGGIEARRALTNVVQNDKYANELRAEAARALGRAAKREKGVAE